MKNYKMWINGEWVNADSGKTYTAVNPATEEEIATIPMGDSKDVDKAVEAARRAFPEWSKKPQDERSRILFQIADSIRKHTQEFVELDILDHGSPARLAYMFAMATPANFENAAEVSKVVMRMGESRLGYSGSLPYVQREAIGVCACINPWNVPLAISIKIAAALAVGNTCVVKPPSVDSLSTLKLAEILAEHDLPKGAVNVVTGPGETVGTALASHPGVDMVAFTGSCATGKAIMAAASQTVKRLSLELGGKNPFIVMDDTDLDAAVERAAFALYLNTGMICAAPGRFYIHEKIYDEFISRFVARSKKVVVGVPADEKTEMGPVVSAEHRDRVESYIQSGIKEGAKLMLGGKRPTNPPFNKGFYLVPTIFTDVRQNMTIAREEIFGPVACIIKFSSDEEAIRMANDTTFGLCASVWTKNIARARMLADSLQAGTIWINNHMGGLGASLWGGFKQSGFGKENDFMGQEEYTQVKVIEIDTAMQ